jgi:hypothetical protein
MAKLQISFTPLAVASAAAALVTSKTTSYSLTQALGLVFSVSIPFFIIWQSIIYPIYFSPLRHVPTVPGFPLWGQFYEIITHEVGIPQRKWHARYGPIIRYYFPLGSERLSITDDEALKHMTVRNPYNFPKPGSSSFRCNLLLLLLSNLFLSIT